MYKYPRNLRFLAALSVDAIAGATCTFTNTLSPAPLCNAPLASDDHWYLLF